MNVDSDHQPGGAPSQEALEQWPKELAEIRRKLVAQRKLNVKKLRDCWVVPYDGGFYPSLEKNPPAGALPAFATREPHGLEVPREVSKRVLELFSIIPEDYSFPEMFMMVIDRLSQPVPPDEDPYVTEKRLKALAWCRKYRELYPVFAELAKDKLLLPELNALLMAVLQTTRASVIIRSARDTHHRKAIERADAFTGKGASEVSKLIKEAWLKSDDKNRKPEFYFTLVGGTRTIHGYWRFPPLFSVGDFIALPAFVAKLRTQNPISNYLWNQFSASTQEVLTSATSTPKEQKLALVQALDNILKGVLIYETARFAGVALSPKTLALRSQNPTGKDLIRLNRLLLEDAYPLEIAKSPNKQYDHDALRDSLDRIRRKYS